MSLHAKTRRGSDAFPNVMLIPVGKSFLEKVRVEVAGRH